MGVHTYERLVSPKHIRIIILEPSSDPSSDLRFSFHQGSLDELEDGYETISYCWGVGLLTCPLYAPDGTTVKVTENLGHALRRFRLKEEKRPLWADAACINQNNNEEKAVQIPLMVEIFRKAKRVLAWLGSGRHEEEESMRSFGRLSRITEGRTFPDISQLKAFFGVDWFKRMWVIQEVVFNTEVSLFYGTVELSWLRFSIALDAMNTDMKAVWDRHAPEVGSQIAAILTIRNLWMSNCGILANLRETSKENATPKNGILDLMTQFANYKCSEPKDRIYALYSMASDLHPSGLNQGSSGIIMTVDYSLGLQETYRNFALSAIDAGHLTDILHSAAGRTIPEHLGWPSWLPDWRLSPTVSPKLKRTKNPAFVDGLKGVKFVGIEGNILHFIMNVLKEPDADSGTAHIFYPITAKGPAYIRTSLRGEDTEGNYIAAVDGFYNNKYRFRTLMESKVEPWYYNIKTTEPIVKWSQIIKEQFPSLMKGRCAFIASHHLHLNGDLFGIGSAELQIGDVIVVDGAHESSVDSIRVIRAALILRDCKEQSGGRKCWRLVGDATIMREPKGSPWFEARSRGIVKISLV